MSEVTVNYKRVELKGKRFEDSITLEYGDNNIYIRAVDGLGNPSDKNILIFRPEPKRKDYALLFAVENYDHWSNLRYPIFDAKKIQQVLEQIYGFQTELIVNPTREDIFIAIQNTQKKYTTMRTNCSFSLQDMDTIIYHSKEDTLLPVIQNCQQMTVLCYLTLHTQEFVMI